VGQALDDLGAFQRIAALERGLVRVGAGFPLFLRRAVPLPDAVQQAPGLVGRDQGANRVGNVFREKGEGQFLALEVELRVGGGRLAAKAAFTDRFDRADAVLGVVDVGSLLDFDDNSPVRRR